MISDTVILNLLREYLQLRERQSCESMKLAIRLDVRCTYEGKRDMAAEIRKWLLEKQTVPPETTEDGNGDPWNETQGEVT